MFVKRLIAGLVGIIVLTLLIFGLLVRWKHINANERGVKVGLNGIDPNPVLPGSMRFYCPLTTQFYVANVGQQRFVMNNTPGAQEPSALGREKDEFIVRSTDNQDMFARWRYCGIVIQ